MRHLSALVSAALSIGLLGCPTNNPIECRDQASCDLSPGGVCTVAPSGSQWCAYPDTTCPSGMRYSDQRVGDGLSGVCVDDVIVDAGDAPGPDGPDAMIDAGVDASILADWVETFGAGGEDYAVANTAPDGSVVVTGTFSNTVTVGGMNLTATNGFDLVVAKFATSGTLVWARRFGGFLDESGTSIAVDAAGDVVVVGSFYTSIDFGGGTLNTNGIVDIFVAKLSGIDGGHIWSRSYGGSARDSATAVALDSNGDVFVAGTFSGAVSLGGTTLTSSGTSDAFVAKYSAANGQHVWSRNMGTSGAADYSAGIAVSGGDVFYAGSFTGAGAYGGAVLNSNNGSSDIVVARYAGSGGTHVWSARYGGTGSEEAGGIGAGNASVVVVGDLANTGNLGGADLMSVGGRDAFVAKYDMGTGAHIWSKRYGGMEDDRATSVFLSAVGNPVVGGWFRRSMAVGSSTLNAMGESDLFVAELLSSNGDTALAVSVGGVGVEYTYSIAGAGSRIILAGAFRNTTSFFGMVKTSNGVGDAVVLSVDP